MRITAPTDVLRQRLGARGREDAEAIACRMVREAEQGWPAHTIRIVNDGPLVGASVALHDVLAAHLAPKSAIVS